MNKTPKHKIVSVCEDYIGFGLQIRQIAEKRELPVYTVSAIISNYLGNEKIVSMLAQNRYEYYQRMAKYTSNNLTIYEQKNTDWQYL